MLHHVTEEHDSNKVIDVDVPEAFVCLASRERGALAVADASDACFDATTAEPPSFLAAAGAAEVLGASCSSCTPKQSASVCQGYLDLVSA